MSIILDGTTGITTPDLIDSSLTSGRVVYAGASGNLTGSDNLTFSGTSLTLKTGYYEAYDPTDSTSAGVGMRFYTNGGGTKVENGRLVVSQNSTGSALSRMIFYVNTGTLTEQMSLNSTGLGIGTSSPTAKLGVAGNAAFAGSNGPSGNSQGVRILTTNTSGDGVTIDSYAFGSNGYGPLYLNTGNAGTPVMTLTVAGNVGIGTSSPAATLTVAHASGVDGRGIRLVNSSNSQTWENRIGVQALENTAYAIKDITADAVRLLINTSGNVGIGTNQPNSKLTVTGGQTRILSSTAVLSNPLDNGSWSGAITVNTNDGAGDLSGIGMYVNSSYGAGCGIFAKQTASNTADLTFFTGTGVVASNVERMRIDSSGNVGIGTSSPTQKLHVLSASATATVAKFSATNYGNLGTTYIEIGTQFSDGGSRIGSINPTGNQSILVFETMTGTSGTYAERARIDNNGSFLINCTSVPSGGSNSTAYDNTGDESWVGSSTGTGGSYKWKFYNGNGLVGTIVTSGSSTAFNTSSDYRLKENIAPMTGALATVAQLKPCTYTWKADGASGQGFIAHELAEVVPDCVSGEKDALDEKGNIKPQGIDTSYLVATLTAAIQEQQAIIESLKARLDAANL